MAKTTGEKINIPSMRKHVEREEEGGDVIGNKIKAQEWGEGISPHEKSPTTRREKPT